LLQVRDGELHGPGGKSEPIKTAIGRAGPGAIEVYAQNIPRGAKPDSIEKLYGGMQGIAGGADLDDRIQFAFGAQFVELHVHLKTREIRCPRILGAFAAGRIMNARTAPSQLMGGLIRGLSSALHEATEIDRRFARFTNTDLSDYMIPVNVDVGQVDVIIVPEEDRKLNDLGIKGLGELGNVGVNALFNATGVRVRDLPIRIEQFLGV
jgi:xanthine dehydrogenase YagR molybdenum-binding subunit